MFSKSKKFIAVVLTVITLFSLCSVAVCASEEEECPTIYLTGYGSQIFSEKHNHQSEMYYPTGVDVASKVEEALIPCLMELAFGASTGDYSTYCDTLYNTIAPIYDNLRLSPDGTVKDNSGSWKNSYAMNYGEYNMIHFSYDWRLSPVTLAADLDEAIDIVLAKYDADKVNLVSRCYGSNVVASYLELYSEEAQQKVNKVVYYVPSVEGIGLIGAIFSGEITLNSRNVELYVKEMIDYLDVMEDGLVKDFILVMLSVFEQAEILGFGTDTLQDILDMIKDDLLPRLVRDSYGSFLSFWAMVPDAYLADAIEFVYNTDELKEEYAGSIELITEYNEKIQKNAVEMVAAQDEIYDVCVIAKYNLPSPPAFGKLNETGDGIAETRHLSFGATVAQYGSRLSTEYIGDMDEEALNYLSADQKIDASTCALPNTTWFIKNNYHDHFPESIDTLIHTFITTDDMTVFTDEQYPQFLEVTKKTDTTLTPVTGTDKDLAKPGSDEAKFEMLFEFIKFAIELLFELVKIIGEMS